LQFFISALIKAHERSSHCFYIEPDEQFIRLRLRVDDSLDEELLPTNELFSTQDIINQLLLHCDSEQANNQKINLTVVIEKQDYELQLLPLAGALHHSLTVKLKKKIRFSPALGEIDIPKFSLRRLRDLIKLDKGLVLVIAPKYGKKQQTLYALMQELNTPNNKIISLESTIQLPLPRVSHIQYSKAKPYEQEKFAQFLLEQDPDIICLDEEQQTPLLSTLLSQTLDNLSIFSAVQAGTSIEGLKKLQAEGVHMPSLSLALNAIMTQRKVKHVCLECKAVHRLTDLELDWASRHFPGETLLSGNFTYGEGCKACKGSGLSREQVLYELICIDKEISAAIGSGDLAAFTTAIALRQDFETLEQKAFSLAKQGVIPINQAMLISA
jgi:type II secretory ATPase GspE/PulE/Tfp pilus assembly ATPase PilB-like protein